jgi:predicted HicB family RNase H-like nuclease
MTKESDLLHQAEEAAHTSETWADLSNWLFDPADGLVARAFPGKAERAAFVRTEEYRRIRKLIHDAQERSGLVRGATPKKSGRFVVRLPRSLHAALEQEATQEGVSLNQLVVAKLSAQLSQLVQAR